MTEKIQTAIENTKDHIKWEQETIDKYTDEIQKYTASATSYDIITFLPGKIEQLKESMNRKQSYEEQLKMLTFLQNEG